jgi:hypothetical protein
VANSCNSYPTFQDNLWVPSYRNNDFLTLEGGNYHYALRNSLEERRSHLLCGGNLNDVKSDVPTVLMMKISFVYYVNLCGLTCRYRCFGGFFAAIFKGTQKHWYRYTKLFFQVATSPRESGPPHC